MAYRQIWEIEVSHAGLGKYRHIRGSDKAIVEQKARAQMASWNEMWERKQVSESKRIARENAIRTKEENKTLATTKTAEAREAIEQLETLLHQTLTVNDAVDWDSLINKAPFHEDAPQPVSMLPAPREPSSEDPEFHAHLGLLGRVFAPIRAKRVEEAAARYEKALGVWRADRKRVEQENNMRNKAHAKSVAEWQQRKSDFERLRDSENQQILDKKMLYLSKEAGAITDYCEMVLTNSKYPDYFPQEWDLEYDPTTNILIVDYALPNIDLLPRTKEVKFIASRGEFAETTLADSKLNKLYDTTLYQIALRTIHELFEADSVGAITAIVFNGWVESIDKATGNQINACIMSLQTSREEFLRINLEHVDPKACFRQLKGVGSSSLHGLSPVAPILSIDKSDRRFVPAYDVVNNMSEGDNLAAMDWQDFENLIREVFEKEFVSAGGEVKITQASRDGGIDAVAFDPDPIRGGKIVIQAKRYTNVVGVSAVRDLYGTTINEGATKGILVTTSYYGNDAYAFATGKPLTLLNGSNLLHLLEKHGHRARIDLAEAKSMLSTQNA